MNTQELFYPDIRAAVGPYEFNRGIEIEIYSEQTSYFDWAKIRFTPEFQERLSISLRDPGSIQLGYGDILTAAFEGYVSQPYNDGGYRDEIVLKDKMLLLESTFITNTFLDVTPQEIISYCLAQAGITEARLSEAIYQPQKVIAVSQKNVICVIKEIEAAWGIRNQFFFSGGIFYWGKKPEQERLYHFEYGINIIKLDKPLGAWELETVSVPFIRHSHKIMVSHPKVSGEFEVKKIVFRTNGTGFIRSYINF